jgi:hypothetical protein
MIHDNYGILSRLTRNKNAFWFRIMDDGVAHYIAGNRAARRMFKSREFQNLAKANGLMVDHENMAVKQ